MLVRFRGGFCVQWSEWPAVYVCAPDFFLPGRTHLLNLRDRSCTNTELLVLRVFVLIWLGLSM